MNSKNQDKTSAPEMDIYYPENGIGEPAMDVVMTRRCVSQTSSIHYWSIYSGTFTRRGLAQNTQLLRLLVIRYFKRYERLRWAVSRTGNYSGRFSLKGNVPHVACNVWLRENWIQIYVVLLSTNLWNSRSHTLQATCGTLQGNDDLSSYLY